MKRSYIEFAAWAAIILTVVLIGHWAFSVDTHAQEGGTPQPTVTPTTSLSIGVRDSPDQGATCHNGGGGGQKSLPRQLL